MNEEKNPAAVALGKLAAGVPKKLSPERIEALRQRQPAMTAAASAARGQKVKVVAGVKEKSPILRPLVPPPSPRVNPPVPHLAPRERSRGVFH